MTHEAIALDDPIADAIEIAHESCVNITLKH